MLSDYEHKLRNSIPRFKAEREYIHDKRNAMGRCPYCNGNIKDRKIALYKGLINALYKVYVYCGQRRKHTFSTKEIKHLLGKNEYNRFGDLVRFGGIIYKPKISGVTKKGQFGMNMERAKEFFSGKIEIPIQISIDQITGETIEVLSKGKVNEFPDLSKLLTTDGLYDHELPVQGTLM